MELLPVGKRRVSLKDKEIICHSPFQGFPGGSMGKKLPTGHKPQKTDAGSIPGLGRFPGEGNGNPL